MGMTLKEQIMKLQTYKMYEGEDTVYVELDDILKLIEQQPCEDCISRQAVLDNAYAYGYGLEPEGYCVNVEDIQALPPVTPQPNKSEILTGWIPVSERLPEKTGKYLVTVKNGNVYAGVFDEYSGKFQCAATAWMPLPEPYRSND